MEPRRLVLKLGQKLLLISLAKSLVPLKFLTTNIAMKDNITPCSMALPKEPGEMLYFARHNVAVKISHFELMMTGLLCFGLFCDCSQPFQTNILCGCMFEGEQGPCVTEYTLNIPSLSKISNNHDME